jgi:DNA-binding NarL/FixJ family response regulator
MPGRREKRAKCALQVSGITIARVAHAKECLTMSGSSLVPTAEAPTSEERKAPGPPQPVRVVIADDHTAYRSGLASLLRDSGIDVVGEASNGFAAIQSVEDAQPDVVVMNLNMQGLSGVQATRRLTEQGPGTRVLVHSVSVQESDVTDAIAAGASGYVLKDRPLEELVAGIRAVARGESPISPGVAAVLVRRLREAIDAGDGLAGGGLSAREVEVLDHRARGQADPEIAEELRMSHAAVRSHISSILTKLRVELGIRAGVGAVGVRDRSATRHEAG